jgi:hypothetical protein
MTKQLQDLIPQGVIASVLGDGSLQQKPKMGRKTHAV